MKPNLKGGRQVEEDVKFYNFSLLLKHLSFFFTLANERSGYTYS